MTKSQRRAEVAKYSPDVIAKELIKEIAMDIGKDTVAYVEVMYPQAIVAASSTFTLSLRNHIHNEIMAAIELNDPVAIRDRLATRVQFRKKWLAQWRKIRGGKALAQSRGGARKAKA